MRKALILLALLALAAAIPAAAGHSGPSGSILVGAGQTGRCDGVTEFCFAKPADVITFAVVYTPSNPFMALHWADYGDHGAVWGDPGVLAQPFQVVWVH